MRLIDLCGTSMTTWVLKAHAILFALLIVSFASLPAIADWAPDRPLRTQTIKDAEDDTIVCTYYPDIVVRVAQTNTPAPGDATLVHARKPPPACSVSAMSGILLNTRGSSYIGRRGPYLFFEEADPNGAIRFSVIDARTGHVIAEDGTQAGISVRGSTRVVAATPATLTLDYRRAVNLTCSIVAKPAACWAAFMRDRSNAVAPSIARLAPPVRACARSYALGKVDSNDPSVIAYDVRVKWKRGRGRRLHAVGPVGCQPLP